MAVWIVGVSSEWTPGDGILVQILVQPSPSRVSFGATPLPGLVESLPALDEDDTSPVGAVAGGVRANAPDQGNTAPASVRRAETGARGRRRARRWYPVAPLGGVSPRAAGGDRVAEGFTDGAGVLAATEGLVAANSAGTRCARRAARNSTRPLAARRAAGAFTADTLARRATLCATADPAHAPVRSAGPVPRSAAGTASGGATSPRGTRFPGCTARAQPASTAGPPVARSVAGRAGA